MSSEALLNSSLPHDLVMGGISRGGSQHTGISKARIRVGWHFLLQGIIPIQGLDPHLLLGRQVFTTEPPGKCPLLCDPMDCNSPGSSVHGVLQARILEWVAILSHSFLQGIFLTKGSNPGLLHCRKILYHLSHQGSPVTDT